MSIDAPPPPPPPPPDHHEKTPMERWEAAEDRLMAENIVANRQEAEILRQQGNVEGAQRIEDSIAKLPVSDEIKADPQGYLYRLDHPDEQAPATSTAGAALTPMERWEAAEDRLMAENIVANRQEAEILRQQGNVEGAQRIEDSIAKLPVSDEIKADPQGYLDDLDRTGRAFTVQTPWPRPEGEPQPAPLEFKDLGRAGDLLPEDQRAADQYPLPMAFLHSDPDVAARAQVPEPDDPAAAARADQGHQNYPGVDIGWHNREPLREGTYLVQTTRVVDGEPQDSRSPYFTSLETLRQSGGDAYEYNTLMQVGAYRGEYPDVAVYRLIKPVDGVAEGTTSQNTQFGVGGGDQVYLRGTDGDHAINPRDNPEYFERVPYSEVKDYLGYEGADISDDSTYIPMSHKSSPVDPRGLDLGRFS